ncbi:hypothetical protein [Chromobacterium violaceum]|uniref:hypothetical protein n=1 Tax=Chromobacterium violaceum TaxID=536 RepID=UPI000A53F593|nr:hypothetical protein [Chromobacterium violaceum]
MTGQIEICFAKISDEPQIVEFLRDHWRADHIFVTNPELMRWQHTSPDNPDSDLTFVLARRTNVDKSTEILALLGYIPFRRFDPEANWTELSLAIWKVRDDAASPGLGLQLLKIIQRKLTPALICAIGTSQVVRPIYQALNYKVGSLSQAALFPIDIVQSHTTATGIPNIAHRMIDNDAGIDIRSISGEELPAGITIKSIDNLSSGNLPHKSWNYILNRYARHPYYEYEIRTITADSCLRAILIWRKVATPTGSVLRIVDIIGDANVLARCGAVLREELTKSNGEYIDLMHWGVPSEVLLAGGFVQLEDYPELVLPNYFEPFENRNVTIEMAFRIDPMQTGKTVYLYRADSDQDRPNQPAALKGKRKTDEK